MRTTPLLAAGVAILAAIGSAWGSDCDSPAMMCAAPRDGVGQGVAQPIPPGVSPPASDSWPLRNCDAIIYENIDEEYDYYMEIGPNLRLADDCKLAGLERGVCRVVSNVMNANTASRTVVLELWDACPQDGGVRLAFSSTYLLSPGISELVWDIDPPLSVGNSVWVAWKPSDYQVGPLISEFPSVGTTEYTFGSDSCGGAAVCTCFFVSGLWGGFDATIYASPVPGACCDVETLVCTDGVLPADCPVQWRPGLCAELDPPCGTSACCLAETGEDCQNLTEEDCLSAGGVFFTDTTCNTFICPLLCPPETRFGQWLPDDPRRVLTSDTDASDEFRIYDNFSGVTEPVSSVRFWGIQSVLDGGWGPCEEDPMAFRVGFFEYNDGFPGAEVCAYTVLPTRTDTGRTFGSPAHVIYEYSAILEPPCMLTEGWFSVQGIGGEDCWFLWLTGGDGVADGCWQLRASELVFRPNDDMSLCLGGDAWLSLVTPSSCYSVGEVVVVDILMHEVPEIVRGGQFFLEYDTSRLQLLGYSDPLDSPSTIVPGDAPFTVEIYELVTPEGGWIDYAVGIPDGADGTREDTVLARVSFTAVEELCEVAELVKFRQPHEPPTRLSGAFGNEIRPETFDLPELSFDDTPPTATQGTIGTCYASGTEAGDAALAAVTEVSDDCTPADEIARAVILAGLCEMTVTVRLIDACGNYTDFPFETYVDGTPPAMGCAGSIGPLLIPAPDCALDVNWSAATAVDVCDGDLSDTVVYDVDYEASSGWTDIVGQTQTMATFPPGVHLVTARATDSCGNTGQCSFPVVVLDANPLVLDVELEWPFSGTRCLTFEVWNCDPLDGPTEVEQVLTFSNGVAQAQVAFVACGQYSCITARDPLHTLRQTAPLVINPAGQYEAAFLAADGRALRGGNLNDDAIIDILDYGVYSSEFTKHYDSNNDSVFDPNTTCATVFPHAEVTGFGLYPTTVFADDFSFIQANFGATHAPDCCGVAGGYAPLHFAGPVELISIVELQLLGLEGLEAGDVDADGWLAVRDMAAFAAGARPRSDAQPAAGAKRPRPQVEQEP